MKRIFDILVTIALMVLLSIPMIVVGLIIKVSSRGRVLFWSRRVGMDNRIFEMPKFRTMRTDTPDLATHLLEDADSFVTPFGAWLRKYSIDEFPQLWSVLKGDMSLVGPRPALYNQYDLIELRTERGVHMLVPGITGWAQINGRDSISIRTKVEYDEYYLKKRSFGLDMVILWRTFGKVVRMEDVKH
ncbi:MAG: sugar transferase [Syntrophorhabdus sp.]|nr:sugar transferase [Syntrophorhabdus sp.]